MLTTFKTFTLAAALGLGFAPMFFVTPAVAVQKPDAPAFTGEIKSKEDKEKLFDFLLEYEKKTVTLDLTLTKEQVGELDEVEKGKILYISIAYKSSEESTLSDSGAEILIHIEKGMKGLTLDRETGKLRGTLRVTQIVGPHMGIMSVNLEPVGK